MRRDAADKALGVNPPHVRGPAGRCLVCGTDHGEITTKAERQKKGR